MCGRYLLMNSTKELKYILQQLHLHVKDTYHTGEIFPSDHVPIIISIDNQTKVTLASWGFSNTWNKGLTINARSETIFDKTMFKDSILHHRCIIPASGFYEWKETTKKKKDKYYFTNPKDVTMYFAGIYKIIDHHIYFVILTKEANDSMSPYHHRMPVILASSDVPRWLNSKKDIHSLITISSPNLQSNSQI